jgi:hypothetical protein
MHRRHRTWYPSTSLKPSGCPPRILRPNMGPCYTMPAQCGLKALDKAAASSPTAHGPDKWQGAWLNDCPRILLGHSSANLARAVSAPPECQCLHGHIPSEQRKATSAIIFAISSVSPQRQLSEQHTRHTIREKRVLWPHEPLMPAPGHVHITVGNSGSWPNPGTSGRGVSDRGDDLLFHRDRISNDWL